jgi:hypothetical protein
MLIDIVLHAPIMAALPPPPEPGASPGSGGDQVLRLVALGLVLAAAVALAVGLRSRRLAAARRRGSGAPPVYRIEHWHNGEVTILGYCDTPSAKESELLVHASRLQAHGERGAVVLVEQASDRIAILRPL